MTVPHDDILLLRSSWASRAEAVTAVKQFFTGQGKQALIDPQTKGGRSFMMVCSTRLQQKAKMTMHDATACQAQVMLTKSTKAGELKPWRIHAKRTHLEHMNCAGKAHVTTREVVEMEVFQDLVKRNKRASRNDISTTLQGIGLGMPVTTAYRARNTFAKQDESSYVNEFQCLQHWATNFNEVHIDGHRNGTAVIHTDYHVVHADETRMVKRFAAATVVFEPSVRLWLKGGQRTITMMDAAHSKHEWWKGMHLGMVSIDGDNKVITLAWGLCLAENSETYTRFLTDLNNFKLDGERIFQVVMNSVDHINFSDRLKGIPIAQHAVFPAMRAKHCFKHIIRNMCASKDVKGFTVGAQSLAWAAQSAVTEADFRGRVSELQKMSPTAANYLLAIPHNAWALYPDAMLNPLYGHRTSNLVECANSKYLSARQLSPLRALDAVHEIVMKELAAKRSVATSRLSSGYCLTKHAEAEYEKQRAVFATYTATQGSDNVYIVSGHRGGRNRVDLAAKTCQCTYWTQFGIPCRHAIAAAEADGRLANYSEFIKYSFHPMYLMDNYCDSMEGTICEVVDLDALIPDGDMHPSLNLKLSGRPRKRRRKSRGEDAGAIKQTKCSSCGEPGHNSRTCRSKQFGAAI